MFWTVIYPSSGACDYSVELPHWSYCSLFDVCWSFGVVGLEWYPCCRLKQVTSSWSFILQLSLSFGWYMNSFNINYSTCLLSHFIFFDKFPVKLGSSVLCCQQNHLLAAHMVSALMCSLCKKWEHVYMLHSSVFSLWYCFTLFVRQHQKLALANQKS